MKKIAFFFILIILISSGCVSREPEPSQEQIDTLFENYKEIVENNNFLQELVSLKFSDDDYLISECKNVSGRIQSFASDLSETENLLNYERFASLRYDIADIQAEVKNLKVIVQTEIKKNEPFTKQNPRLWG